MILDAAEIRFPCGGSCRKMCGYVTVNLRIFSDDRSPRSCVVQSASSSLIPSHISSSWLFWPWL